ncbi:MAG: cell envelope integrity protein CreD [Bacteroidota bacterium]
MQEIKSNIFIKLGIIGVLILILLMPTSFIQKLIDERQDSRIEAVREVSLKQGGSQTITGPYISIPFTRTVAGKKDGEPLRLQKTKEDFLHLMPESLEIQSEVIPEKKYRGLFEVVTYRSISRLKGHFKTEQIEDFIVKNTILEREDAHVNIGISDLKGMQKQIDLNWQGETVSFEPGLSNQNINLTGISAPIKFEEDPNGDFSFDIEIELKGSNELLFTPLGKSTQAMMNSSWPDPKLTGSIVSDRVETSEDGFEANWNVLNVNRNFPQAWKGRSQSVGESAFGAEFIIAVDNYTRSTRVAKYSILFIALTFITFFFVEILRKVFIHPIQYLLVGSALVIFYTLLLAFSEHVTFNVAYLTSAGLTIGMISLYTGAILKSRTVAFLLGALLTLLYAFIFVIIQMESFSLLIGSLAIFLILAIIMFFTRNIDWYELKLGSEKVIEAK